MANAYDIRRAAARAIKKEVADMIRAGLTQMYTKAIQEAAARAEEFGEAFQQDERGYREKMFKDLGQAAQRSMLASYGQTVTRREGPASRTHYRAGEGRLAGGVLKDAIGSSDFFTATADGLDFGNTAFLDEAAAHWHRINFGAAGAGEGSDAEFPVNFGGSETALGIEEGPSPGFDLPPGVWLGADGGVVPHGANPRGADAFYPTVGSTSFVGRAVGQSKRRGQGRAGLSARPTAGIEAANFMDAGVRRIANELPDLYEQYIQDLYDNAVKVTGQGRNRIDIVQGQPKGVQYRIELP